MLNQIKKFFTKPLNENALRDKYSNVNALQHKPKKTEEDVRAKHARVNEWEQFQVDTRKQFEKLSEKGLSIPIFTL